MSESPTSPNSSSPGLLSRLIRDQRLLFLVVGGINTVIGFGIFVACSESVGRFVDQRFGTLAGTLVTIAISHPLGVLFAFAMYRRFVFRVRGHVVRDLMRFWSVYLARLGFSVIALPVLIIQFGLNRVPAQAILLVFGTAVSYFGHRHFSFRRATADNRDETPLP